MDMEQLSSFRAVAELKNFTAAAEVLGISQPALSRSVQRLEDEMGQPLFNRKPRCVELTDAGALFLKRAIDILRIVDDTKAELCDDGRSGRIRVAAIPTIAPYFLPDRLREFADSYPQATVSIHEDTTEHLVRMCGQGELDLAFLALPIVARHVDIEPLFEEELFVVLPSDHALASSQQIELSSIEALPFVLLGEAHCLSGNVVSFCQRRSIQPVVVERTSQLAMVQELVSLGHGISMVPKMAMKLDHDTRRVYRPIAASPPLRTIAMMWNPYKFQSKLARAFQDHLREKSQQDSETLQS